MRITVDQVMSWDPCDGYPREGIERLMAGRKWITPRGIAKLDIPPGDRMWVLCHAAEDLDRADGGQRCDTIARRCALDVIDLWDAPEVVRRYLQTGDEPLRDAARAAAWAAAGAATWAATWAATRDAAGAAAWAAARAAAGDATWDATWAAAWAATGYAAGDAAGAAAGYAAGYAAWSANMDRYIQIALEVLP